VNFSREGGRSRDTSGSAWWTSVGPSHGSSAPVVAAVAGGGDMFVAILLGCAGAFVVIVVVVGIILVLRWSSKRTPVERSPLKNSSLSNTRCTNFNLNYLSPSSAPASYSSTAKVVTCFSFILLNRRLPQEHLTINKKHVPSQAKPRDAANNLNKHFIISS